MNDSDMIAKKADDFVKTLDKAKTELVKFEQVLNQKDNEISSEITKFSSICADLSKKFEKCGKDLSCVDKALNDVIEGIANSVKTWQEAFESSKRGKKFMHDHQKFLATMVFGAVKAGKSTLGNFLAGREWLNAPFDNVYKHLPVTQFDRQEQARSSGGMTEPDSEGRRWFCEGVTDTTGDILTDDTHMGIVVYDSEDEEYQTISAGEFRVNQKDWGINFSYEDKPVRIFRYNPKCLWYDTGHVIY